MSAVSAGHGFAQRAALAVHVCASGLPLLVPVYGAALTLIARWQLGRWPVPCSDDPLGVLGSGAKGSWDCACVIVLVGWVAWFAVTPVLWFFEPRGWLLRCSAVFLACTAVAVVSMRYEPLLHYSWLNAMD
jgi:hypothetical protein